MYALECPWDKSIKLNIFKGTFYKIDVSLPTSSYQVLCKVTNIRDGNWVFDDQTNLLYNDIVAIRIK